MEAARAASRCLLGRPRAGRGRHLLDEFGTHPSASTAFPPPGRLDTRWLPVGWAFVPGLRIQQGPCDF